MTQNLYSSVSMCDGGDSDDNDGDGIGYGLNVGCERSKQSLTQKKINLQNWQPPNNQIQSSARHLVSTYLGRSCGIIS